MNRKTVLSCPAVASIPQSGDMAIVVTAPADTHPCHRPRNTLFTAAWCSSSCKAGTLFLGNYRLTYVNNADNNNTMMIIVTVMLLMMIMMMDDDDASMPHATAQLLHLFAKSLWPISNLYTMMRAVSAMFAGLLHRIGKSQWLTTKLGAHRTHPRCRVWRTLYQVSARLLGT